MGPLRSYTKAAILNLRIRFNLHLHFLPLLIMWTLTQASPSLIPHIFHLRVAARARETHVKRQQLLTPFPISP